MAIGVQPCTVMSCSPHDSWQFVAKLSCLVYLVYFVCLVRKESLIRTTHHSIFIIHNLLRPGLSQQRIGDETLRCLLFFM